MEKIELNVKGAFILVMDNLHDEEFKSYLENELDGVTDLEQKYDGFYFYLYADEVKIGKNDYLVVQDNYFVGTVSSEVYDLIAK